MSDGPSARRIPNHLWIGDPVLVDGTINAEKYQTSLCYHRIPCIKEHFSFSVESVAFQDDSAPWNRAKAVGHTRIYFG